MRSSPPSSAVRSRAATIAARPAAAIYATVMGPPLAIRIPRSGDGSMVCTWSHPELDEYEMPAIPELVIALQTSGPGVRMPAARGWSRVAPSGSIHVVPSEMATRWKVDGSLGFLSVHVGTERIRSLIDRAGTDAGRLRDLVFRFAVRDRFLNAASRELARELRAPTETGSLYADLLADGMVLRILRLDRNEAADDRPRRGLSDRQLVIIRERIEASLESGVTLAELAEEAGLSRFHFARAFKESTGLPPQRYVTMRRIERAKQLLANPRKSLAEVALEAGFSSQSHFTGRFREIVGSTPLRYRNERR
jgi:AraC family transcriptional regulator